MPGGALAIVRLWQKHAYKSNRLSGNNSIDNLQSFFGKSLGQLNSFLLFLMQTAFVPLLLNTQQYNLIHL